MFSCFFGLNHKWNGCLCTKCGKKRSIGHEWDGCYCVKCNTERDEGHLMHGCVCIKCGRTIHDFELIENAERWYDCSACDGLGYDKDTMSQQSGQGGANPCHICNGSGKVSSKTVKYECKKCKVVDDRNL